MKLLKLLMTLLNNPSALETFKLKTFMFGLFPSSIYLTTSIKKLTYHITQHIAPKFHHLNGAYDLNGRCI